MDASHSCRCGFLICLVVPNSHVKGFDSPSLGVWPQAADAGAFADGAGFDALKLRL